MVASTISRVSLRGSPTLSPPIAYPGNPISIVRSADSFLSAGSIPPRPAQRQLHRRAHPARLSRVFRTFIKRHDDVRAKSDLRFGRGFRAEELCRAVQMGTECHAFLGQFAQLAQAEDLKSPRVGENRPIP